MASSTRVSVPANTPTLLVQSTQDAYLGGTFLIDNDTDVICGVGGSTVTATTSARVLKARSTLGIELGEGEALYALTPAGSATIVLDVLQVR